MVDGINFNGRSNNVSKTDNGNNVRQNNTAALPNMSTVWNGVQFYTPASTTTSQPMGEQTVSDMQQRLSPAIYEALQAVAQNFDSVPYTVMRNTDQAQLVIDPKDYIPDREFAQAEV